MDDTTVMPPPWPPGPSPASSVGPCADRCDHAMEKDDAVDAIRYSASDIYDGRTLTSDGQHTSYPCPGGEILLGNSLDVLRTLESESVQTCITSPAYWGPRDYGTGKWEGGNDPACEHKFGRGGSGSKGKNTPGTMCCTSPARGGSNTCPKCGAHRVDLQLGQEETPEEYVQNLVDLFAEVYRILKPDGTLWLNLGDSSAGSGRGPTGHNGIGNQEKRQGFHSTGAKVPDGYKAKDLIGIPWRVAFALQAAGWYLRSDIIWQKPNPMPESVQDRPTRCHEYIFLFSKSGSPKRWRHAVTTEWADKKPAPDYVGSTESRAEG